MASKYLTPNTTASYASSTRLITGAAMLPSVFDADDQLYGRSVIFRIGTSVYSGRISAKVSDTSVKLLATSGLPGSNGTIDELIVLDTGTRRVRADYLSKLGLNLKDDGSKLDTASRDAALDRAVLSYSLDKPYLVNVRVAGTGADAYSLATILGSLYVAGQTDIQAVEYPAGDSPRSILDRDGWDIYDDGTAQDGSNLKIRFLDDSPPATENFVLTIDQRMSVPAVGVPTFPDTDENFENITNLATSVAFEMLAAAYAPSTSSTLSADIVDHGSITDRYLRLAKIFREKYNIAVFGNANPSSVVVAASSERSVKVLPLQGERVFH